MALLLILLAGQALASMDGSMMAVAAPSLRADLHASGADIQLTLALYVIVFAALVVIGARLGDLAGRRRMFMWGIAAFTAASLVGGLAPSAAVLIVARGLQGVGAALMTPQVLALIQINFTGEARARAIGAYSVILAVGVATGQVVGGLIIGAHLLPGAWRPALLLNVPVGIAVFLAAGAGLRETPRAPRQRVDVAGAALVALALLAAVVPLSLGRQAGWPAWVWPSLAACPVAGWAFVRAERRIRARGRQPLFELSVLAVPGVAAGVLAVALLMGAYAGFLLSLTLHLQGALRFGPAHAGVVFAVYAAGFAVASLSWTRLRAGLRSQLPIFGPLLMGAALTGIGAVAARGGWPALAASGLLFGGGVGHACGYSPLASRLTVLAPPGLVTEVSGLLMISALAGNVVGVAAIGGIYLSAADAGSGHALELATLAALGALLPACACAARATRSRLPAAEPLLAQTEAE